MRYSYSQNLITNGETAALEGWNGSGVVERGTFKINDELAQTAHIKNTTTRCLLSFDYLPLDESQIGADVNLSLNYASGTVVSVTFPARV